MYLPLPLCNYKGIDLGHTWMVWSFSLLQFQSEFGNEEFMIWATVSSWSCFCWLYRAYPPSTVKNIINLVSIMTTWWCPCVESSLVLLVEDVWYDQWIFLAKLHWPLPCFILYSEAKFPVTPSILTSYFCLPVFYDENDIFFLVFVILFMYIIFQKVKTYAKAVI